MTTKAFKKQQATDHGQRYLNGNAIMNAPSIELFDTTLRDGTQGEHVTLSVPDKMRIARRLDAFGIDVIEGGWPGSNPKADPKAK